MLLTYFIRKGFKNMKTAYDLFKRLLEVMADIDRNIDSKSKTSNIETQKMLDKKLDILETEMFEIRNKLKSINL
jgi:hypothetical protein